MLFKLGFNINEFFQVPYPSISCDHLSSLQLHKSIKESITARINHLRSPPCFVYHVLNRFANRR